MKNVMLWAGLVAGSMGSTCAKEVVRFPAADGTQVYGEYYPAAGKVRGAVVLMHQRTGNTCEYGTYPQILSQQGYAVLAVDLRIGGNSFGCLQRTKAKGGADIFDVPLDIRASSQWLLSKAKLQKVILVGSSYSGGMVLMYAGQHPEHVAAAVAFSPASIDQDITAEIIETSRKINVPVLVVAPETESGFPKLLLDLMPGKRNLLVEPKVGIHGAVGLVQPNTAAAYQEALLDFLKSLP